MRSLLISACSILTFLSVTAVTSLAADEPPKRPNILLIVSDDQRWDTVSALGNPEIKTPNIDALVKRGFVFRNTYCMGSMIPAVCAPSRTMLITGQSLWKIPKPNEPKTPAGTPVLSKILREAGYATFHVGKQGNSCRFGNAEFETNIETKGRTAKSATEHADAVIEFLNKHDGKRPFFAYVAPPVPHDPRLAPEKFQSMYDPATLTLAKNFMPEHPFDNGELRIRDELLAPHPRSPEVMKQHLADYYATISHLDTEVGRILQTLEACGLAENTIVIYTSDQGLAVGGQHGLMGKQNLYEHVRPPLVIVGPGIPKGESQALVYLFDLMPTILDWAGEKIPAAVDGKSLVPVITGKSPRVREYLLGAYKACQRMVRDERWKLLKYNAGGVKNVQLFDLQNDPDELNNLADDPKFARERERLEAQLAAERKAFGDPADFDGSGKTAEAPPAKKGNKKQ
jgi:arylsulfatase A-like enzyme